MTSDEGYMPSGRDAERSALELLHLQIHALCLADDGLRRENAELQDRVDLLESVLGHANQARLAKDELADRLRTESLAHVETEERLREGNRLAEVALADARAAHIAKDQFLASLSHELRTPLTPVLLAAASYAEDPEIPPKLREHFEMIRSHIEIEARLIDDLLDQTRIEKGLVNLVRRDVDAHALLKEALRTIAVEFSKKDIRTEVILGASFSRVNADPVRLLQIFWNLLRNAAKFTPPHGQVSIITDNSSDHRLFIRICDSGIGLSPEECVRIFLPFTQGVHAAKGVSKFGGLGLGLTISRQLAELHGGTLKAESEGKDLGTTFTLVLRELDALDAVLEVDRDQVVLSEKAEALRILLVEDHAPTRDVLSRLLAKRGHRVTTADCTAEARGSAAKDRFDVVISDIGLPDGTGWELMRSLHEEQPGLAGIALSGYGMDADLRLTQAAGFQAHLVKPISLSLLEDALSQVKRKPGAT